MDMHRVAVGIESRSPRVGTVANQANAVTFWIGWWVGIQQKTFIILFMLGFGGEKGQLVLSGVVLV